MHELSIAHYLLELVEQQLEENEPIRVVSIQLRIGALTCVHRDSLLYCFDLVAEGTILEGAKLEIETVPVSVFCSKCNAVTQLRDIQSFNCPNCNTPSSDIRAGQELELDSLETTSIVATT